jgi:hypothetical protein
MMAAYADARKMTLDARMLLAAELRLLLLEWPTFLPYGDEHQRKMMVDHLLDAQHQWAGQS